MPPGPDTFITTGALPFPNDPDPWSLTFHWATAGPPIVGEWQLDAFLEGVSVGTANITVPATVPGPFPSIVPGDLHNITTLALEFRRALSHSRHREFSLPALCNTEMGGVACATTCQSCWSCHRAINGVLFTRINRRRLMDFSVFAANKGMQAGWARFYRAHLRRRSLPFVPAPPRAATFSEEPP